jgi:acyl-CoA thioester hydrolase
MELRVRYAECDMQRRVFNGNYLTWVEMAAAEAIAQIAGGHAKLTSSGVDYVVAAADLKFRRPATFNDLLIVQVSLHQPGNSSLRSEYTILRGEELIAECAMVHVCVDSKTFEKRHHAQQLGQGALKPLSQSRSTILSTQ